MQQVRGISFTQAGYTERWANLDAIDCSGRGTKLAHQSYGTVSGSHASKSTARRTTHRTARDCINCLAADRFSNQWTFGALRSCLQWVMGWQDSHAHEFRVGERCIGPDWWIQEIELDGGAQSYQDERRVSIAAVVRELGGVVGEFESLRHG